MCLLRATPSYSVQPLVAACHESTLTAFMDLAGFSLSASQRLQATLPLRTGGCGLKGASDLQPAARLAALCTFYGGGARRVGVPAYASGADASTHVCAPILPSSSRISQQVNV